MAYLLVVISVFALLLEGILIKKYNTRHLHGGFIFVGIVSLIDGKHLKEIVRCGFPHAALAGVAVGASSLLFLNISDVWRVVNEKTEIRCCRRQYKRQRRNGRGGRQGLL